MKTADIKGIIRENTGGKSASALRKNDKIPAVVYGESGLQHIEVDYLPMSKLIHSPSLYLINLEAGGKETRVIIQDTQFHPVSDKILHIDFLEAAVGKTAILDIPVVVKGICEGVINVGGNAASGGLDQDCGGFGNICELLNTSKEIYFRHGLAMPRIHEIAIHP